MVFKQVQQKSSGKSTENGYRLEILDLGTIREAKRKALISFAVTAKLICTFVFAYADCWFSYDEACIFVPLYFMVWGAIIDI